MDKGLRCVFKEDTQMPILHVWNHASVFGHKGHANESHKDISLYILWDDCNNIVLNMENEYWWGCGEIRAPTHDWRELGTAQLLWEPCNNFPKTQT